MYIAYHPPCRYKLAARRLDISDHIISKYIRLGDDQTFLKSECTKQLHQRILLWKCRKLTYNHLMWKKQLQFPNPWSFCAGSEPVSQRVSIQRWATSNHLHHVKPAVGLERYCICMVNLTWLRLENMDLELWTSLSYGIVRMFTSCQVYQKMTGVYVLFKVQ